MSDGSSSGSWQGGVRGAARRGGDIIDLDQYMRGARPPRQHDGRWAPAEDEAEGSSGSGAPPCAPRAPRAPTKRPSHDSGLSDGSYRQPRRKHHTRRSRAPSGAASRTQTRAAPCAHARTPGAELAHMRSACERALRTQGEQIARVRRFCDQLDARKSRHKILGKKPSLGSEESSDLSSSSSARTPRHRDEFKTYKIIMTKLDELNRMFCARSSPLPPAPHRGAPSSSSSSLSVSDKPAHAQLSTRSSRHLASRRAPSSVTQHGSTTHGMKPHGTLQRGLSPHGTLQRGSSPHGTLQRGLSPQASARLAPLRTLELSISPHEARPRQRPSHNVHLESVVKCESSSADMAALSANPVRLRDESLQKRESNRSSTLTRAAAETKGAAGEVGAVPAGQRGCSAGARGVSLCGRCRELWRALTGRSQLASPERA